MKLQHHHCRAIPAPADTCAEFLLHDPRLGEPTWKQGMVRKATEVSIEILRPIRDAMARKGFIASEITGGKPWGSGCCFGEGKSRVSVFFYPVPAEEKKRWEGSIRIIPAPPVWRRLSRIRDRSAEERMVERVAAELRLVLAGFSSFRGIRWVSLQLLCSSKGYADT
jgi:hypothetical protein